MIGLRNCWRKFLRPLVSPLPWSYHRASRAILAQFFENDHAHADHDHPVLSGKRGSSATLLSAALQEYLDKRVVLLIDDPFGEFGSSTSTRRPYVRSGPGVHHPCR